jgi:hypothetical protein
MAAHARQPVSMSTAQSRCYGQSAAALQRTLVRMAFSLMATTLLPPLLPRLRDEAENPVTRIEGRVNTSYAISRRS